MLTLASQDLRKRDVSADALTAASLPPHNNEVAVYLTSGLKSSRSSSFFSLNVTSKTELIHPSLYNVYVFKSFA